MKKLRLTESARLLIENPAATVSEVAYSVGYGNVSYFNKLFKNVAPRRDTLSDMAGPADPAVPEDAADTRQDLHNT